MAQQIMNNAVRFGIYFDDAKLNKHEESAADMGMSLSSWIRKACDHYQTMYDRKKRYEERKAKT